MASNDLQPVNYVFARSENIDIENKIIHSSIGGEDVEMTAGMVIATYDSNITRWLYVAYDENEELTVHDITGPEALIASGIIITDVGF